MPSLTLSSRLTMHYLDLNSHAARTVLLVHGLGVTAHSWQRQIPALVGAGYRVLAPDLRGFGRSTYPGNTGIAPMAHDLFELCRRVGRGPVDVVGISMGGTIALRLALDHAAWVARLVLVNTAACLRPRARSGWLTYALRYLVLETLGLPAQARLVAWHTFPRPDQEHLRRGLMDQLLQSNRHGYLACLRALGTFNVLSRLAEIQAPTLVITGDRDTAIPPERQRPLADGIRGAQHVVFPGAGHGLIADRADEFNRVLVDFLGNPQTAAVR